MGRAAFRFPTGPPGPARRRKEMHMEICHNQEHKRFDLLNDEGEHIGEIEYTRSGTGEIYATHTGVAPQYEGQGLAGKLLDALAGWAQEEGAKIVPLCPYVIHAFKKYPEKYARVIS